MKMRTSFIIIILLIIYYYIVPIKIKDIIVFPVHSVNGENILSDEMKDSIINNLKEDNEELKKLSNINLSISDFDFINGTVIERNREYWFNTLTINKGTTDGVDIDMAVIDSNGLIGRISMVTKNTSTIKLITTNDIKNKVSAVIHNNNEKIYGIINGYDSKNNLLNLIIDDNKNIIENSKVETTGMGGVFPSGILIGKVVDVIKKDDGITNVVRVKPSSSIKGERYVSILKRKKNSIN